MKPMSIKFGVLQTLASIALVAYAQNQQAGQSDERAIGESSQSLSGFRTVIGRPFEAIKYRRIVKMLPGGKQAIVDESNVMQVARDSEGRVRIETAAEIPECEQLASHALEKCPDRQVIIFDPSAQVITHWIEGNWATHGAVVIKISSRQFEDVEESIRSFDENPKDSDTQEEDVRVQDLGQKIIEGVRATGIRKTTVHPAKSSGNNPATATIHESWKSEDLDLPIKIVDGDLQSEVAISGLEHIQLTPDASLFLPPAGYSVITWNDRSELADKDLIYLADWAVK